MSTHSKIWVIHVKKRKAQKFSELSKLLGEEILLSLSSLGGYLPLDIELDYANLPLASWWRLSELSEIVFSFLTNPVPFLYMIF